MGQIELSIQIRECPYTLSIKQSTKIVSVSVLPTLGGSLKTSFSIGISTGILGRIFIENIGLSVLDIELIVSYQKMDGALVDRGYIILRFKKPKLN